MSTPYRNETDALRERKTSLEGELARLREQTSGLDQLRARHAELAQELAQVDGRLNAGAARRLPLLDQVRVASPCTASWSEMVGDDRVRYCLGCEKNVYNLSSMARPEAEALLQERLAGELCVRFYQRADGTILTQDCPVGVKKKRRKKLAIAVAGAGALAAAALTAFRSTSQCTTRMGEMQGAVAYNPTPNVEETATPLPPVAPLTEKLGDVSDKPVTMGVVAPRPRPMPVPRKEAPAKGVR